MFVRAVRGRGAVLLGVGVGGTVCGALALRGSADASLALMSVVERVLIGGGVAGAWIAGAAGLGWLALGAMERLGGANDSGGASDGVRTAIASGLGVALALWLAHLMGAAGMYAGRMGGWWAWAIPALGMVVMVRAMNGGRTGDGGARGAGAWVMSAALGAGGGVMLAAAANPPGALWRSEAHGYDVLSYHLQLPKEWLAGGRLMGLEHNVYSWLPSYMEAVYLQLGAMMGRAGGDIAAGTGMALYAAAMSHAGLALVCAWMTAVLVRRWLRGAGCAGGAGDEGGEGAGAARLGGAIAGGVMALTPWVVVVSSLAYNEMAACVCVLGALLVVELRGVRGVVRGVAMGVLMGAASGAKPTWLIMAGVAVGAVVLMRTPRRELVGVIAGGAVGGVFAVGPWLVRNGVQSGNPVFPFGAGLFGSGHWSAEQASRFARAHAFDGGLFERVGLLFSADRGVLHGQWSVFFMLAAAGLVAGCAHARTRRLTVMLGVMLALQAAAWMFVGHLQARFLLPLVVAGSAAVGVGAWVVVACARGGARRGGVALVMLGPLVLGVASVHAFVAERDGAPNRFLIGGVEALNGSLFATDGARAFLGAAEEQSPEVMVNLGLGPASRIGLLLLVGDATPLYYTRPVVYHTTWDRSPLGEALERAGGDAGGASRLLRGMGITHVLVNGSEVERLSRYAGGDALESPERVAAFERGMRGGVVMEWPAGAGGRRLIEIEEDARDGVGAGRIGD